MGRRALFWSGAVLVGLILQQAVVWWFGPDANRWLGMALLIVVLLSVPAILLASRVEGVSRWRRWREARQRAVRHHRS
jgi:membrane protein YdbS with pleckstrin-like domain